MRKNPPEVSMLCQRHPLVIRPKQLPVWFLPGSDNAGVVGEGPGLSGQFRHENNLASPPPLENKLIPFSEKVNMKAKKGQSMLKELYQARVSIDTARSKTVLMKAFRVFPSPRA